jgi:mannose-1-phosphate guanylyltransferase
MNKNYYAILMAGGIGSRFWPVSTKDFPKQFHDMLGTGETLLQRTFNRLNKLIPRENIFILTNEHYENLVLEQLDGVKSRQIVLEPAMRNTAPCILYAALKIYKENPDALMLVAPSDHWIEDENTFANNIKTCFDACNKKDVILTLGIKPTFPNTGYGYIEFEKSENAIKKVKQFREKPTYDVAKEFVDSGNFLWNAGIFMWSAATIINAFKNYQPDLFDLLFQGDSVYNTPGEKEFIKANYSKAENISIDYAILEYAKSIYVLPAMFDWNDLGTWGSLYEKLEKDEADNAIVNARVLVKEASGNMIRTSKNKVVVVDGIDDYIIVDKEEVLLIYPKSKEQHIKQVLQTVKNKFGDQLG